MAIKKSELYSSLWKSCDELRGGMDASQYKDYVLVLLFVKYVSDKYAGDPNSLIDVPAGGSFADMVALKGDKEIGDKINQIIARLAEANNLTGVIDVADFNDQEKLGKGKEMVDLLSKLVSIFDSPGLDFRNNRAQGDDILGDAYEYLMRHFATESGKSKGQFYTPAEVSRVIAQIIGIANCTDAKASIYDPTCGSGSLLLKAHDEAKSTAGLDLAIYGQEKDNATSALAKMNMILHDCPTAEIWKDNTLSAPHFKDSMGNLKLFDFIVANPPFSTKAWSNGFNPAEDEYNRFGYGIPPEKNGDYAFLLHILSSLKSTGKAAVILPHGVLFRPGAEAAIRKRILQQGYIQGVIGLPANLFYGTPIPACIIVLDKEGSAGRKGLFLIDASKGFIKDGNKNRLQERDIHRIVDTFIQQREVEKYSRLVPMAEIEVKDWDLNIPRYIDTSEAEDLQDIHAHLHGGIPERDIDALQAYWNVMPSLRDALFSSRPSEGEGKYLDLKVAISDIKPIIFGHPEFDAFRQTVAGLFGAWRVEHRPRLAGIAIGDQPKALLKTLAEDLMERFEAAPLLDAYDVYQHLQDYWYATLQDDMYQLVIDGWRPLIASGPAEGQPNTDLLPPELIVLRYYPAEAAAIDELEAKRDAISRELEELDEEQGGEDGPLAEGKTDNGKLTAASVKARLKAIKNDHDAGEEHQALEQCLALIEREAEVSKKIRSAQKALNTKVLAHYALLSEEELKILMLDDKWLAAIERKVQSELDRVSQVLADRIRQLAERYAMTLPALNAEVEALEVKVNDHLVKMGFSL